MSAPHCSLCGQHAPPGHSCTHGAYVVRGDKKRPMGDIVERLRANLSKYPGFVNLNEEAAAEIERLRLNARNDADAIGMLGVVAASQLRITELSALHTALGVALEEVGAWRNNSLPHWDKLYCRPGRVDEARAATDANPTIAAYRAARERSGA